MQKFRETKKNLFHKTVNILFIIGAALGCLCGCDFNEQETVLGQELVEQAREDLSQLKSGVITVTNNSTGEAEQQLVFKYDEVGILLYSLTGKENGQPYSQYCNGYKTYTLQNGELDISKKGDADYKCYTYDVRYPMTDADYLYFSPDKIAFVSDIQNDDGSSVYSYTYDEKAISSDEALGELTAFAVTYAFDRDGELSYVDEISVYEKDGEKTEYSYRIEISQRNSVGKLEMPDDIKKMTENAE